MAHMALFLVGCFCIVQGSGAVGCAQTMFPIAIGGYCGMCSASHSRQDLSIKRLKCFVYAQDGSFKCHSVCVRDASWSCVFGCISVSVTVFNDMWTGQTSHWTGTL